MVGANFYPSLDNLAAATAPDSARICIVTPDLLGPVKNGGIGTACGYLAFALADAGHDLNILFCQTGAEDVPDDWIAEYAKKNIKAANALAWNMARGRREIFPNLEHLEVSRAVHDWLISQPPFDIILFMDWQGAGFYSMHAKACGQHFTDTALGVVIHSPSYWHSINNAAVANTALDSCLWHMERKAIEMADFVISPSRYMLQWTQERLCKLPRHAYFQPNLLEWEQDFKHDQDQPISELVFFGRLEFRKGLEQFCGALDRLAKINKLPAKVTFLGKCSWMGDEHSALYIAKRALKWPGCEVALETQKGHKEAVEYICGPGRMAVMPSIADNSPYTVYECLAAGVPFLARDVGGIAEFLPEAERETFLFGDNPGELAQKLAQSLYAPPKRGHLVIDSAKNAAAWRSGLPALGKLIRQQKRLLPPEKPFISVILTHYNRPTLLAQALESLYNQDSDNFEVILVDDGSDMPEAISYLEELRPEFLKRGWRILALNNCFAPAARNRGAEAAKGDWLLFFDDDNLALPGMISACGEAARNRQTGLIALMFNVFEGQDAPGDENRREVFLPTGDALAYSSLHNTLADTTSLIHKKSFWRVGGFREDYGVGHEDFELFLRFALSGESVAILPEPMFWYRKSAVKSSVQLNTNAALNRMRSLRPFLELLPPPLAELALMTHSMGHRLNMFPDPAAAGRLNLPIDRTADPDELKTMLQAAHILASQGHTNLAAQIIGTLPGEARSLQASLICARASGVARDGDIDAARACMAEFADLGLPPQEAAPLYEIILQNLSVPAKSLRREILNHLRSLENKNALSCLLIASESADLGNMEDAGKNLFAALQLAEEKYQESRPDVSQAMQAGAFICGLQHFALHGSVDKTPWPEKHIFGRLLLTYPKLAPHLQKAHMKAYNYADEAMAKLLIDSLAAGSE